MKCVQPKGHTYEKPKSGGNKPDHMKHVPDHMLEAKHGAAPASMTHATLEGRSEGSNESEEA